MPPTMSNPRISVVVLTHNRIAQLIETLSCLQALPERPPIVVADNASSDGTVRIVDLLFPGVRVVQCATNLGAAGRNRGVACVQTDYVAFCDDDTCWQPGALAEAVRVLDASPQIGIVNARVAVGTDGADDPTCAQMAHSPLDAAGLPGPSLVGYMAGACVMRTALFRALGGYDARLFIGGEEQRFALDVLTARRAIVYCASIVTVHRPSPVRDSPLRRRMLARNAAWTAWQRLPLYAALTASAQAFACFYRERTLCRDGLALLRGLVWALRERHVVPLRVLALRAEVQRAERRRARHAAADSVHGNAARGTVSPD
ncbi:MAG TPA: glycosyltransferase [Paraburkholderia sp.]|jgi:GT2 family glycosyltransferase|nr:glycosyltransferase [Paraburkholderia sp.]